MEVTPLVILLAAASILLYVTRALHRALIGNRSWVWRLAVAVAGLGYGLTPSLRGTVAGTALAILGAAAGGSLVVEAWHQVRARRASRRQPIDAPIATTLDNGHASVTELERADQLHSRRQAFILQLDLAAAAGNVGAQAAIAGEVTAIAHELHDALDIVFAERYSVGTAST